MRARALLAALVLGLCRAAGGSTLVRHIEALEGQIDILRRLVAETYCARDNAKTGVTATGAWCLFRGGEYGQRPVGEMHFMDEGIGPLLSQWFSGKRILDLGAGSGQYGTKFELDGANVSYHAVDGAINVVEFTQGRVKWADLAAPVVIPGAPFDWVMSLEVGEHIPKPYEHVFLGNLHENNECGVMLSWAVPGQSGHGHVNNQPNEYVIGKMDAMGYDYNVALSTLGRASAQWNWFHNTFMAFDRRGRNETRCALSPAVAPAHPPPPAGVLEIASAAP